MVWYPKYLSGKSNKCFQSYDLNKIIYMYLLRNGFSITSFEKVGFKKSSEFYLSFRVKLLSQQEPLK